MEIDKVSRIATLVIGLVTLYFAYKTSLWDDSLKGLDVKDKSSKLTQEQVSFDREFKFKIYELAVAAIKTKDTAQQQAAYLVVSTMVEDTTFKTGLLNLFTQSKTVPLSIKKAATVAKFDIKVSKASSPIYSSANKLRVDIFYLVGANGTKAIADRIYNALTTSDYYQVKLRPLSDQRRSVLKVKTNEIRFDPNEDEKAKAEKLKEIADQILFGRESTFTTQITTGKNATPGYLSYFVVVP